MAAKGTVAKTKVIEKIKEALTREKWENIST